MIRNAGRPGTGGSNAGLSTRPGTGSHSNAGNAGKNSGKTRTSLQTHHGGITV